MTTLPPIPPMPNGWEILPGLNDKGAYLIIGKNQPLYARINAPSPALTSICILMAHWWEVEERKFLEARKYHDSGKAGEHADAWRKLGGLTE